MDSTDYPYGLIARSCGDGKEYSNGASQNMGNLTTRT
jgi:hypothetical protein